MIRKFEEKDIEAVNEIYNQAIAAGFNAHSKPISLQQRKQWFQQKDQIRYPSYVYLKNEIGNEKVVAWLYFSKYRSGREVLSKTAEVSYYVHNNFKGIGIGSALLKYSIQIAPTLQFKHLVAILLSNNRPSINLLKKFGFEEWGRMPKIAQLSMGIFADHLYYGKTLPA